MPEAKPGSFSVRLAGLLETAGVGILVLLGALVPLFVFPVDLFFRFDTIQSEAIVGKNVLLVCLCGALFVCAAGRLLLGAVALRWRSVTGLFMGLLGGLIVWGFISVLLSPVSVMSLVYWTPRAAAMGAVLCAPCFLTRPSQVRLVLVAMMVGAALVAIYGLISALGFRGLNRFFYGVDPRDVFESGTAEAQDRIQGGLRRSIANSTLANPEYSGTYAAAMGALGAVLLLDWTPAARRRWVWRGLLLVAIVMLLLLLTISGSRQPWVALVLAAVARLFMYLRTPPIAVAGGFCAVLVTTLLAGIPAALVLGILLTLAAVAWAGRHGLAERLRASDRFNLLLTVVFPGFMLVLLIAFSTPGPWNPFGSRILDRFGSLMTLRDRSYRERATMYLLASEMIWRDPIFGVGPGRYGNRFTPTMGELIERDDSGLMVVSRQFLGRKVGVNTHNDYLQIAAELGIPALLFFLGAILVLLYGLWQVVQRGPPEAQQAALAVMIGLIAFLAIMLTSFPLQMPSRLAVIAALMACGLALVNLRDLERLDSEAREA